MYCEGWTDDHTGKILCSCFQFCMLKEREGLGTAYFKGCLNALDCLLSSPEKYT